MSVKYLSNGFSSSMIDPPVLVEIREINKEEFCGIIPQAVNTIGHKGTSDLINELCGTGITVNRVQIKAKPGDIIYIITLMIRLEEGKVLGKEDLKPLLEEGKIKFMEAKVLRDVAGELVKREGVFDERNESVEGDVW